jgi:hypothetical protein
MEWNASHSIDTAMVTKVPISSISTNHSLSSIFSNSPLSSSRPSGNRSPYVGSLLHRRRSSRYCRLYSTSHDALSEARHSFLLHGSGTSASPPHCGRPGTCSMLKMWMMSTRITAVLLRVETVLGVQAVLVEIGGRECCRRTVVKILLAPIPPKLGFCRERLQCTATRKVEACLPCSERMHQSVLCSLVKGEGGRIGIADFSCV